MKVKDFANLPDFIAVLPEINVLPGRDTECLNVPGVANVEDWLAKDVRDYTIQNLPAQSNNWMITGYSTGGWCASEIGVRHQDQYGSAVSLAGYFSPTFSAGITSSERATLRKEYDLVATLHSQPNTLQMLAIYSHQNDFESKSLFTFQKKVNDVLALKTDRKSVV